MKLRRRDSLSDNRGGGKTALAAFFLFSERLSDALFRLLFYLHGPSRLGCWLSGSQYNLDHHQGNNVLLLPTVSGYISTSAPSLNPPRPAGIFYSLYFCVLIGQHYFWFSDSWDQNTTGLFSCVFGVWLTESAEFIFTSWGKIWLFALSLPFNLSCRMEGLFNSSITRKCPTEHKRSGANAREAGYLDLPPPTSIRM